MGGIAIDIWEKSNLFGSIGSQKGANNTTFLQGGRLKPPPASCRVKEVKLKVTSFWECICLRKHIIKL